MGAPTRPGQDRDVDIVERALAVLDEELRRWAAERSGAAENPDDGEPPPDVRGSE